MNELADGFGLGPESVGGGCRFSSPVAAARSQSFPTGCAVLETRNLIPIWISSRCAKGPRSTGLPLITER
jgi:hypothetical protein